MNGFEPAYGSQYKDVRQERDRMTWHEFFASQSRVMALRSTCQRLAVGCVVVRDKRMIASGYNGSIIGDEHCIDVGCKIVEGHCVRAIHAEQNALLQCARFGIATHGADVYVTHLPCLHCTKSMIQAGVKNIYFEFAYRPDPYAAELLEKSKINIEQVRSNLEMFLPALDASN